MGTKMIMILTASLIPVLNELSREYEPGNKMLFAIINPAVEEMIIAEISNVP